MSARILDVVGSFLVALILSSLAGGLVAMAIGGRAATIDFTLTIAAAVPTLLAVEFFAARLDR